MIDALARLRQFAQTPSGAVRWACLLEATAPKAGNVFPGRSFADLTHADFVAAAEITAQQLTLTEPPMPARMLAAVRTTTATIGNNVNLGIVLLLGPLVAADQSGRPEGWRPAIAEFLDSLGPEDGKTLFAAIAGANPGGLGESEENDVRTTTGPVDLVTAMTQAADRDRIARQYATDYADLFDHVLPLVGNAIDRVGDVLGGISQAHLEIMSQEPDSLIARKCGHDFAVQVRDRAAKINIDDTDQVERFDQWLRSDGHRRNPGTTADLIAASLYVILRTDESSS